MTRKAMGELWREARKVNKFLDGIFRARMKRDKVFASSVWVVVAGVAIGLFLVFAPFVDVLLGLIVLMAAAFALMSQFHLATTETFYHYVHLMDAPKLEREIIRASIPKPESGR